MPTNLSVLLLLLLAARLTSLPLSAHKRWIVDDATGKRVKLVCTHWVAHFPPMLAEGLNKLPINDIASQLPQKGFNCVRLSYATYMFTRYANRTVADTLSSFDIPEVVSAVERHNPWALNMTHLQAFEAVVDALGAYGVMVLLDNHVSMPGSCCHKNDQNGFFGDRHFQPHEWLSFVANYFKENRHVVAMDLRNEPRGERQNLIDWYKYMRQGARTIHEINPNSLVIISGLTYDTDLSFLKKKPLDLNFTNKLVYEAHQYSMSLTGTSERWYLQPVNRICASLIESMRDQSGFLIGGNNPAPLFITEFGYGMSGDNYADNKFLPCITSFLASMDLDWSLWTLGGSYYYTPLCEIGVDEGYGLLNNNWTEYRDKKFPQKFQLLQRLIQDPTSNLSESQILFHLLSGNCVSVNGSSGNELVISDCKRSNVDGGPIRLVGSALCLKALGEGLRVILSRDCVSKQSSWRFVSMTGLHLATTDEKGKLLCLDMDSDASNIVTRKCICIDDDDSACLDDPQSQWFQLISTNV